MSGGVPARASPRGVVDATLVRLEVRSISATETRSLLLRVLTP